MTLAQIKYFLTAVEMGSFSAAAEELYISQSSFSKQIKSLEDEIGAPLFLRANNRISLTEVGKAFLKYAHSLDSTYTSMRRHISTLLNADSKVAFTLGTLPLMHEYCIAEQLTRFQETAHDVQINIFEANQPYLLRGLDNGTLELAIVRMDYLSREKYKIFPLRVDHLELVCTTSVATRFAGRKISLRDLRDENFVILDDSDIYTLCMDCFRKADVTPKISYTTSRHLYLLSMVNSGLGMCLLPKDMVNTKMFPNLVSLHFEESAMTTIGIAQARDTEISAAAGLLYRYFTDSGLTAASESAAAK